MASKMAQVLGRLGSRRAFVVHGNDGLDEISIAGSTRIWELEDGEVIGYEIEPEDAGVSTASLSEIQASDSEESARILRAVLEGESGAARDIVVLNASAALLAGGLVDSLKEGVQAAAASVDSGKALQSLEAFTKLSQSLE
jgi:anthranilate phosphoribosyltransferase